MHPKTIEQIPQCNRCGSCLSVCPVYQVELVESRSPRGKMALARKYVDRNLPLSERVNDILSECLLCGSCVTVCPAGVQGSQVFTDLRRESLRARGADWRTHLIVKLLGNSKFLSDAVRCARFGRSLVETVSSFDSVLNRVELRQEKVQ